MASHYYYCNMFQGECTLQESISMPTAQNPWHRPENPRHYTYADGCPWHKAVGFDFLGSQPDDRRHTKVVDINDNAEGFPWPSAQQSDATVRLTASGGLCQGQSHRHTWISLPTAKPSAKLCHVACPGAPGWGAIPRALPSANIVSKKNQVIAYITGNQNKISYIKLCPNQLAPTESWI